jgi:Transglutaminase elicitor/Bacterial pre-peptidase C-terminal domain
MSLRTLTSLNVGLLASFACLALGCAVGAEDNGELLGNAEQHERWSNDDNPSKFDSQLEYSLAQLPLEGEATNIPWPGSYWPTASDSIDDKWGAGDSPADKYGAAFGVEDMGDRVSRDHGILSQDHRTACKLDSECKSDTGEKCAKRDGEESGYCIPTWFGLCHGWAPAAILEPEPVNPVTRNNVTFEVNDIKALMTLLYTNTETKFLSSRCNSDEDDVNFDEYGRPESRCRDTNPGTFHVVAANYLGIKKQSYVEDRTYDDEVWNQPVRGFRVTSMEEVTALEANRLVGATAVGGTTESFSGDVAKDAWVHHGPFTVEEGAAFVARMTGDNDADLYVSFGSQPTSSSYACRPYAGGSAEDCEVSAPAGATQAYVSVNGYATTSHYDLKVTYGGQEPTEYVFNNDAVSFRHVKTNFQYITESSASTDGNLASRIDSYTRTDRYEYVLELDADGRIIGGEWIGASKKKHPDFLWLPISHSASTMLGGKLRYDDIKSLLDESVGDSGGGDSETVTASESGTVAKGAWKHFGPFDAAAGAVKVVMTGNNDADLYVRKGEQPTESTYDCRPYANGSNETCNLTGPGEIFVSVSGWAASSDFTVTVTYESGTTDPAEPITRNESGHVAKDAWQHYGPFSAVAATSFVATLTPSTGDPDLYVRLGAQPTSSSYDCRPYSSDLTVEPCTLNLSTTQDVYVSVNGYAASDYALEMNYTPVAE